MKKYLITGALAIVAGSFLTSCHENEIQYSEIAETKKAQFAENFVKFVGPINENQDWGFGTTGRTRAAGSGTITQNGETVKYTLAEQNPSSPTPPAQPGSSATAPRFRTTTPTVPTTISFSVPNGTVAAPQNLSDGGVYTLSNDYNVSNPQNQKNVTFYVIGDNVVYKEQTHNDGTTFIVTEGKKLTLGAQGNYIGLSIYLAKNATLVLEKENGTVNLKDAVTNQNPLTTLGAMLYLGENSSVICKSNVEFEQYFTIYNEKGTIDAKTNNKQISINGGALIYNAKELKAANIKMLNESAELINVGNIEASEFDMRSGGKFLNEENGKVTIAGTNWIDNMNSVWQNKGDFTCGDFHIENTRNVFNNCKLTVTATGTSGTGTFSFVKNSTLVLDGNNSVKADAMSWGPDCDFYMSNNSMLWVDGALTSTSANKGYGVHGVGTGYSILKAGSITYSGDADQSRMNYFGNVYVDTETHFAQGFKDQKTVESSQPYYYFDSSVKFRFRNDNCPITSTINSGACHHGYTPPTPTTTPTTGGTTGTQTTSTDVYIKKEVKFHKWVFCEDLGSSYTKADFDYNDLVFDVKIIDEYRVVRDADGNETDYSGNTDHSLYAVLTPLAAGGELAIKYEKCSNYIHGMFNISDNILINTAKEGVTLAAPSRTGVKADSTTYVISEASLSAINEQIDILVTAKYNSGDRAVWTLNAYKGQAPHKLCVPPGTRWPYERTFIVDAYKGFDTYAGGGSEPWDNGVSENLYPLDDVAEWLKLNQYSKSYYVKDEVNSSSETTYSVTLASNETYLWNEGLNGNTNLAWSGIEIGGYTFANTISNNKKAGANSIIRVYGKDNGIDTYWSLKLCYNDNGWKDVISQPTSSDKLASDGYVEFKLSTDDVEKFTTGGLIVFGYNFKVLAVSIDNTNAASASTTLFSATPTTAWSVPGGTTDAEITSSYATITGGSMYVTNSINDAKDLIKSRGNEMAFCQTNNDTFFKVTLSSALQAGDIISVRMQTRTETDLGLWFKNTNSRGSEPTAKIVLAKAQSQAWVDAPTYIVAEGDEICGKSTFYIYRHTPNNTYFNTLTITRQ